MKNILYAVCCLSFTMVIGGGFYEHIAVVPQWSAAAPASLTMFQGEFGINPAPFWQSIHPVTLALFILTMTVSWKSARRANLVAAFSGYVFILAITAVYFVPELLAITTSPFSATVDPDLTRRAQLWETFSLIRLAFLGLLSIIMFLGLAKAPEPDYAELRVKF